MQKTRILVVVAGTALALYTKQIHSDTAELSPALEFAHEELTIIAGEQKHPFHIELAHTPQQEAYGLMFRTSLPADGGMLFLPSQDRVQLMWMKNTKIPLDMLFMDGNGKIVYIAERAAPESLTPIGPHTPVHAVLELAGGTAAALGIHEGDRVINPHFRAEQ